MFNSSRKLGTYSNNTIYLKGGDNAILKIFVHEFTHYLEQTAEYAEYSKAVLNSPMVSKYVKQKGFGSINEYINRVMELERTENGRTVSREHAECELVAHFTTDVLFNRTADKNVYDEFYSSLNKEHPEQARGFFAAIKNFLRKIRDLVTGHRYDSQFAELERRFSKMAAEVEQKYGSGSDVNTDISTDTQQKTAAEDTAGGEKSYIDVDEYSSQKGNENNVKTLVGVDGKIYENVVVVASPKTKRINRSNSAYRNFVVENIIKQKITVKDKNNNEMVVEFAGLKERVKKENANNYHPVIGKLTNAKGPIKRLAILNATKIIKNSQPSVAANNIEHTHQWLDENGWIKREAFITNNSIVYPVIIHIAKTADGRNIFYDISVLYEKGVATDKDSSNSHLKNSESGTVRITTPYENRLSHKHGDVKENIVYSPDEKSFLSLDDYADDDSYERVLKRKNDSIRNEAESQIVAIHQLFREGNITEREMLMAEKDVMQNLFEKVDKQTHDYVKMRRDRDKQRAEAKRTRNEVKAELSDEVELEKQMYRIMRDSEREKYKLMSEFEQKKYRELYRAKIEGFYQKKEETERKRVLRDSIRRRVKSFTNTLNANTNTRNIPDSLKDLAKASIGLISEGRFSTERFNNLFTEYSNCLKINIFYH